MDANIHFDGYTHFYDVKDIKLYIKFNIPNPFLGRKVKF